MQPGLVVGK